MYNGLSRRRGKILVIAAVAALALNGLAPPVSASYPTSFQIKDKEQTASWDLTLTDFAIAPKTRLGSGDAKTALQVARINFIRQEPVATLAASRGFVPDLNGELYTFDRATKAFSNYINFASVFPAFDNDPGFAAGLVTVQFDPDYASNHLFYTVHTENVGGQRQGVLTKWFDPNINNATLDAGASHTEMLRVGYQSNIHPLGDLIFNPTATPGSPDWRNLYIASGDGGAGETSPSNATTTFQRSSDQRLDNFLGKILRITPTATIAGSGTASYTVPASNPFAATGNPNVKTEIYSLGMRNPHRLSWDVDPANPNAPILFCDNIGLHSYEELNIIHPGANYGYSSIEGNQVLGTNNQVNNNALPATLTTWVANPAVTNGSVSIGSIAPTYPVAQYSHEDGDAITSGFVYRGTLIPQLQGKYVFGDISTGRLFYCDLADLKAVNDSQPNPLQGDPINVGNNKVHELTVFYDSPFDSDGLVERRPFDIVQEAYDRRNDDAEPLGSTNYGPATSPPDRLPGQANATDVDDPYNVPYRLPGQSTGGRSDIRWALIDNELYLISKSDGVIRALTTTLGGDADLNGIVDSADLAALALHWQTAANWKDGDFSHDGFVDVNDLSILAQHWQQAAGGPSLAESLGALGLPSVSVPEPTAMGLLGLAAAVVLRRRIR